MTTRRRYRCRFCEAVLLAWLAVAGAPDGAMLLGHMTQTRPAKLRPFLDRIHRTEDIARVAAEAFAT